MLYDRLISGYLTHANAVAHDQEDTNFWAHEGLHSLIEQNFEGAWTIVVSVIQKVSDDKTLEYVSADVLESLICQEPYLLIDRIEIRAKKDAHFKKALSNVWGWSLLPADIRIRLDAIVAN